MQHPMIPLIPNIGKGDTSGTSDGLGFTPYSIDGCKLWLRSDLGITKDGSNNVTAWADQSGSGNNATQWTALTRPTWQTNILNTYPGILFGASSVLKCNSLATAMAGFQKPSSLFFVLKSIVTEGSASFFNVFSISTTDANYMLGLADTTFYLTASAIDDDSNSTSGVDNVDPTGSFHYLSFVRSDVSIVGYKDGTSRFTVDISELQTSTYDRGFIGGPAPGENSLQGHLIEVIGYDSALSTANRQAIEAYLATRYGL